MQNTKERNSGSISSRRVFVQKRQQLGGLEISKLSKTVGVVKNFLMFLIGNRTDPGPGTTRGEKNVGTTDKEISTNV